MNTIFAAKQVGQVAYYVESMERLLNILTSRTIYASSRAVLNPRTKQKQHSVSLTRDLYGPPRRRPDKWAFAVLLDGDKLSEHYSIQPYSYAGVALQQPRSFRVKSLTKYNNGQNVLALVDFKPIDISEKLYQRIKDAIDSLSNMSKFKWRLIEQGPGDRSYRGRTRIEGRVFNTKTGGIAISERNFPDVQFSELTKSDALNEAEERIWLPDGQNVNISNCIIGAIIPKTYGYDEVEAPLIAEMKDELYSCTADPKILTY